MSAPLAEGAQPRAGERTLDKRGGSEGKWRWELPQPGVEKKVDKELARTCIVLNFIGAAR